MLLREITRHKGQFFAAAAVIFAGIVMFTASYMSYRNLKNSVEYYYDKYDFLDYYADVASLTQQGINELKEIKGVSKVMGRISRDVGADMDNDKRITLRMISLPDDRLPDINKFYFTRGGYFDKSDRYSCLLSTKFANFYNIRPGDSVKVIVNLKAYEFTVKGLVDSPEYIYALKSSTSFTISAEYFGILYVKESTARSILGMGDSYNQVHMIFDRGADSDSLIDKIEDVLKPYGFKSGTKREDQMSYSMVEDDINQFESLAYIFPALFLTVAASIIYIMQRRIINNQRTLIGVMKAFGISNGRILWHYILYSLLISVVGAVPAVFLGLFIGIEFTRFYKDIFSMPVMQIKIYWDIMALGIFLSMGFCLLAGFNSAKRILGIQPAQAMRSEAPRLGKRIFLEKLTFIWKHVSFSWKMVIRNLSRSRQRTLFTCLGITITVTLFIMSLFFLDCIDYLLKKSFFEIQRQDYKVVFSQPASVSDAEELVKVKGIKRSEPIMELPVEISRGWIKENTVAMGLTGNERTYKLLDRNMQVQGVPENGILIAHALAEKMGVRTGDTVKIKFYLGASEEKDVKVAGVAKQYAGFNCFLNIKELGRLTGEGAFATGAMVLTDGSSDSEIKKELYKISGIETVEGRLSAYNDFTQFMGLLNSFVVFMIFFGSVMGFAIIFNSTIINIMERRRELASLKVLGYSGRQVESIIFRENMVMVLLSIIPGLLLGRLMCSVLVKAFSMEMFALEVVIYPRTYIITLASVFVFVIVAQLANRKSISGLDMVEVLKDREG